MAKGKENSVLDRVSGGNRAARQCTREDCAALYRVQEKTVQPRIEFRRRLYSPGKSSGENYAALYRVQEKTVCGSGQKAEEDCAALDRL
jgi:hypothetical protein